MKTALIIGGAAVAIYLAWQLAGQTAAASLSTTSQPLYPTNVPFPAAPATAPDPTQISASTSAAFAAGTISSTTPVATGLSIAQRIAAQQAGLVTIGSNAYTPRGTKTGVLATVAGSQAANRAAAANGYHAAPTIPPQGLGSPTPAN